MNVFTISSEEKELVTRCIEENRQAQLQLYKRYCDAMYSLAYRITNRSEEAEEVLQDTFVEVFRNIKSFRMESTLGAWIKSILIRTAMRKKKKQLIYEETISQIDTSLEPIIWDFDERINSSYLESLIMALPDGYKTVFVLSEIEGYTHKEIADLLNISEGTSKSQLFRAKKTLQSWLKNGDSNN